MPWPWETDSTDSVEVAPPTSLHRIYEVEGNWTCENHAACELAASWNTPFARLARSIQLPPDPREQRIIDMFTVRD